MTERSLLMRCTKYRTSGRDIDARYHTAVYLFTSNLQITAMVSLSKILLASSSATMKKAGGRGWMDTLRVYVKGGTGGTGLPPVDGVGGQGGSVWVRATEKIGSLHEVRRKNKSQRYVADGGEDSS